MRQDKKKATYSQLHSTEKKSPTQTDKKVDPIIAKVLKNVHGLSAVEEWIDAGYDFSLAEKEYGKDWLTKQ